MLARSPRVVWLAACCLFSFLISVDNLDGDVEVDREAFTQKVKAQAEQYRQQGLPPRTQVLFDAFKDFYINGLGVDDVAKKQLPIISTLR